MPGSEEIVLFCFVSADPGYASDSDMRFFSVDFMHLLERQVADVWTLAEGKHHPVGQALFVQCDQPDFWLSPRCLLPMCI